MDTFERRLQHARHRLFLCDLFRRERRGAAREWVARNRPAMAHDCVRRAREWNQEYRQRARALRAVA